MRIVTWNVNGLRAVLNKDALGWVRTQAGAPDIFCLQEIKCRPDQLSEAHLASLDGYHAYWSPADRPGYSGVATFSLEPPEEARRGIEDPRFDSEGRVMVTRHPGFLLFNIYFPNGQRGLGRLAYKLDFYASLLDLCHRLSADGENIILCGDFNTAHREIDLRNPKQNQNTSGFLPVEREMIDQFLAHGFVDAFRALYPESVQYTWWTYRLNARQRNIGWRLDYFLVSPNLMARVQDVIIHPEIEGSDHCPVSLLLEDDYRGV